MFREFRQARAFTFFARANIRRPWCPTFTMTDACFSGLGIGVVESEFDRDTVWNIGRNDERWRFRVEYADGRGARDKSLSMLDPFSDVETVKPMRAAPKAVWGEVREFPEILADISHPSGGVRY